MSGVSITTNQRAFTLLREGYSVGQVADKTGLATVEVRELLAQAQLARDARPAAPTRPGDVRRPAVQPAAPRPAETAAAPVLSAYDRLLVRARQVPKLAKLVEKHDKLMQQIEERLQVDEQAAHEARRREKALEQARAEAEQARKDYEAAQAKLRELGGITKSGKPKRQFSEAQLASLRANAEKARAAAAAKREAAG